MRVRNLILAAVAAMMTALPARADLVLEFSLATDQNDITFADFSTNPAGTAYSAATTATMVPASFPTLPPMAPGSSVLIQVALRDTLVLTGSPIPAAQSSLPPGTYNGNNYTAPRWLTTPNGTQTTVAQQFGLTLFQPRIQSTNPHLFVPPPAPVVGVDPNAGNSNVYLNNPNFAFFAAGSSPPAFTDFGGGTLGNGAIPNYDYFSSANVGASGSGRIPLFNMRVKYDSLTNIDGKLGILIKDKDAFSQFEVTAYQGVVPSNPGPPVGAGDRISLDSIIFGVHGASDFTNGYQLVFDVTPVPEPSSMALAGMALAGLGLKLRRRMKAKAQVEA